ncbi:hypothetical protein LSM04_002444 [Trypanosoma melophagium]|uniref:uncharacterized protein n=1 Tax=Trypanosoma melophagium TaxID=715481 RepID=UPI003519FA8E|nr:hypothetical protein LSM04_002444 [Trypanosoma melophagium]
MPFTRCTAPIEGNQSSNGGGGGGGGSMCCNDGANGVIAADNNNNNKNNNSNDANTATTTTTTTTTNTTTTTAAAVNAVAATHAAITTTNTTITPATPSSNPCIPTAATATVSVPCTAGIGIGIDFGNNHNINNNNNNNNNNHNSSCNSLHNTLMGGPLLHQVSHASTPNALRPTLSDTGIDTPPLGHNGIIGSDDWGLSPSLTLQLQGYASSPNTGFARQPSMSSTTSQRYCHDPYSLSGSQRLSPQSNPLSDPISQEYQMPALNIGCIDDNATGPLPIVPAVPKEPTAARGRRKTRPNEHARMNKPLPDVPVPANIRYFPPPPPPLDALARSAISPNVLQRIVQRWYDRTITAEPSYLCRISSRVWISLPPMGMHQHQQPASFIQPSQVPGCPRMEYFGHGGIWQWLGEAEQWWDGAIRPLTVTSGTRPPPYAM